LVARIILGLVLSVFAFVNTDPAQDARVWLKVTASLLGAVGVVAFFFELRAARQVSGEALRASRS